MAIHRLVEKKELASNKPKSLAKQLYLILASDYFISGCGD